MEGGVRAALLDTTSAAAVTRGDRGDRGDRRHEFQKRRSYHYTRYLRARDLLSHLKIYKMAAGVPKQIE